MIQVAGRVQGHFRSRADVGRHHLDRIELNQVFRVDVRIELLAVHSPFFPVTKVLLVRQQILPSQRKLLLDFSLSHQHRPPVVYPVRENHHVARSRRFITMHVLAHQEGARQAAFDVDFRIQLLRVAAQYIALVMHQFEYVNLVGAGLKTDEYLARNVTQGARMLLQALHDLVVFTQGEVPVVARGGIQCAVRIVGMLTAAAGGEQHFVTFFQAAHFQQVEGCLRLRGKEHQTGIRGSLIKNLLGAETHDFTQCLALGQ